jgi:RimJ/RimL family protein N-acetyltransferase
MALTLCSPIRSKRLQLRPVQESDLPDLLLINGDDEVTRYLPYATWQSLADGRAWLERMHGLRERTGLLQLVIDDPNAAKAIGTCLLFGHDEASARAELGYVLGRAYWGKGLMQEALTALIDTAFADLGLRRLEAEVDADNMASARLLLGLGFQVEGRSRQRWVSKGRTYDTTMFGLLRSEW